MTTRPTDAKVPELVKAAAARIAELEADRDKWKDLAWLRGDITRAAVLAEREACARIADDQVGSNTAREIAAAIRARPAP